MAGASPGNAVCIRASLLSLGPDRWGPVCAALTRAARDAASEGNPARHLVFALLVAIIDSWTIEIICPSIAPRASAFRDRAIVFADDLTNSALRLVAPGTDLIQGGGTQRSWDSAPDSAEERPRPKREGALGASLLAEG